jgi:hypothetical protein
MLSTKTTPAEKLQAFIVILLLDDKWNSQCQPYVYVCARAKLDDKQTSTLNIDRIYLHPAEVSYM